MMTILKLVDANLALPEIVLAMVAMALLMLGAFRRSDSTDLVTSLSLLTLALVAGLVVFAGGDGGVAFGGSFVVDAFARILKIAVLFASAVAIVLSSHFMRAERIARFEFPVLVLLAVLGMMVMISATDLIALYLGIELQSLALYVVATLNRESARSAEAGLKYFVLGALSSGLLLYGASLVYGFTGTVGFDAIAEVIRRDGVGDGLIFALVFLLAGLAFKISAVPFHMWTPDVYEGAPTPITNFFATAPKLAAMAILVRVLHHPFAGMDGQARQILIFVSIASMLLGAFAAIGQTNIKRLLAYSSIGHMGFALIGLAAGSQDGVKGVIVYMLIYVVMTFGAFACVLTMRRNDEAVEDIDDLAGLARNNRLLAFILAMVMFSLAGIPPLAGFFAKYFVFLAAIKSGLYTLAVIGVLASVVGAYYYLRIVKVMYFDDPADEFDAAPGEVRLIIALAGVFVIAFVVFARPVVLLAQAAAASLF